MQNATGYLPIYDGNTYFDIAFANMVPRSAKEASRFKVTVSKLPVSEILMGHAIRLAPYALVLGLLVLLSDNFQFEMIPGVKTIMEGSRPKKSKRD